FWDFKQELTEETEKSDRSALLASVVSVCSCSIVWLSLDQGGQIDGLFEPHVGRHFESGWIDHFAEGEGLFAFLTFALGALDRIHVKVKWSVVTGIDPLEHISE